MKKDFLEYTVENEDEGAKVDSILRSKMNLSRRIITGLKKSNNLFLNSKPAFANVRVKEGDIVSVNLAKDESQDIDPEYILLDIVFEDNDLLIINKQPGIVVHPTKGHPQGTLANGIIYYWRQKGEDTIVRLVNRLDRDTSGLIIIAKNQFSHQAMAKQLDADIVEKIYICVVHGIPGEGEDTIDMPIDRPSYDSIKREVMDGGQRAVTHYWVMEEFNEASLLKIRLETGKTHQIRVHMSHIGHPLYGDTLYGTLDDTEYIKRQALHAHMLRFNHPRTGESMAVEAAMPEDIGILIDKLRNI